MTTIKNTTKKAADIIRDHANSRHRSIFDAYGRPSSAKVRAYEDIRDRAINTPGYNYDLDVCGAGSSFFSTVYSFTDADGTHIIKDTPSNTFEVII